MPHLDNMNRFVRLLLEMRVDFLDFVSLFVSSRVFFRQSGIAAKMDMVASGSRIAAAIWVLVVKAYHVLMPVLP